MVRQKDALTVVSGSGYGDLTAYIKEINCPQRALPFDDYVTSLPEFGENKIKTPDDWRVWRYLRGLA